MLIADRTHKPLSFFVQVPEELSPRMDRRRIQTAKLYLSEALADNPATRPPSARAKVCMMLGQVEEWTGNAGRADAQFELAIRILEELGKPDELSDAHMAYAELLEGRGSVGLAGRHWKRAAVISKLAALGLAGGESLDSKVRASGSRGTR